MYSGGGGIQFEMDPLTFFIFQNFFIQPHGKTDRYIIFVVILVNGDAPPGLVLI